MSRVRLQKQLDGSGTQSADCGPSTCVMEIDYATGGEIRPSIEQVRKRMGVPSGPTDTADREKAIESYDKEAVAKGLKPLRYTVISGDPDSTLWQALDNGKPCGITIDYGVVAEKGRHFWSSRTFRGDHIIWLRRGRTINGNREVLVYDPLADGRFPGIPNGPQWWPWHLVKDAVNAIWGEGKWGGGISHAPVPLHEPDPKPDPTPAPDAEEILGEVRTTLLGWQEDIASLLADIDTVIPPSKSTEEPTQGSR